MGYVDLHSHVLPGLDDGSPDSGTTITMLRGLAALGFEIVCATPHQKAGQFLPELEDIRKAHASTVLWASEAELPLALPLAAENMWDATFFGRIENDTIPSYDDGSAFLVEFPIAQQLPVGVFDRLFELRMKGKLPVIAHPERYEALWSAPDLVERLRENCALVVDLGAVAGHHGRRQAKAARSMLKRGLAHAAASDAHSPNDVTVAAEGIAWIRKKLGSAAIERLLDRAPRQILAGQHPEG